MEIEDHPIMKKIKNYNITDEADSYMVFHVYMDLCEVQNWWNVRVHMCPELNLLFLSGHPNCSEPQEIVLPIECTKQISPQDLKKYTSYLKVEKCPNDSLTVAVYESDSTIVYLRVKAGLLFPNNPDTEAHSSQAVWNRNLFMSQEEKNFHFHQFQQKYTG
ncbi:tRNA-splicing endonuclease subunit Sen15 [Octopus sinensis]|uniref:tRNA-splicing endonuclease subunit Sen15 n=1 Tax=Octopus sinensis TaxID=2607531 RepID=A0A6P7UAX5_9MOLL|nr:tRNA-splicing endonuclease subunit Sen15 [Octopus sinensis]